MNDLNDRHVRHWGIENQKKLERTKCLILGADILGQFTLGCLSGLGVQNIVFMDNRKSSNKDRNIMFPHVPYNGLKKTERIEDTARKINNNANIMGIHSEFSSGIIKYLGFEPDVIIDTTNDTLHKERVLDYAYSRERPLISAFCNRRKSIISLFNKGGNFEEVLYDERILEECDRQGSITAGVSAGIIIDELRKQIFTLNEADFPLEERLIYNIESFSRIALKTDSLLPEENFWNKNVLVVGAGAIGNYVAANLALSGFKNIDIVDFDEVEDHNLARQIFLYKRVKEKKCSVLAERIREFSDVRSKGYDEKITSESQKLFKKTKYDVVFGCLDNQEARCDLSDLAIEFGIPYIDGGTSPSAGRISSYCPRLTRCVKCKKGLKKNPEKAPCVENVLPSVVIPNIIVGSEMVAQALHILNGNIPDYGFVFDTTDERRIYTPDETPSGTDCRCL